jgi:multidrug resistance efflux pump
MEANVTQSPDATPDTAAHPWAEPADAPDQRRPTGTDGSTEPAPGGTPAFRRMRRSSRIALSVIAAIALLAALGFGGAYWLYSRNYVSTDNAQVDGDKIDINAPATGTLTRWSIDKGSSLRADQIVGRIKILGSFAEPQRPIKSPGNGTVAMNNVVEGQYVTAGSELATGYDFNQIYVTARVDETDIDGVRHGALVDIDVDAYPGKPVTGLVREIQGAAAGVLSLFPESNSTGNFQKVTQVIPVKIALSNTKGLEPIPGMNVTVHVHRH